MSGNGWKVAGVISGAVAILGCTVMVADSVRHCADQKTERERIDLRRTDIMASLERQKAAWNREIEGWKLGK